MIDIAVFPVGGMGTRFLPATKAVPKEMLPVVDRPLLQYAVDEALEAGIRQMVFVTARGKAGLEDYFDVAGELEAMLKARGKDAELAVLAETRLPAGDIAYVRQQEPAGLGHAVWCARHIVGNRPFAVILPDDLVQGKPGALRQMVDAWAEVGGNIIAAERVPHERTGSYGIITPGETRGKLTEVAGLVEKPKPEVAPSNLAVIGRYILQPEVMEILSEGKRGAGNEIQLTDAMAQLIGKQPFHGLAFDGVRHDCGDKAGHVIANIAYALERDDVGPAVRAWLEARLKG
ncbi:UTP--glucose-1-phosphate uridylyltransferase [Sandaracinobacteroides sp. A072]|uniref:UTP--glucose-1-phosphate uridylyltransferase n=1 Tax=Sandaracinobacteroides sp. A072 TaxID=3461146 RepID=UPI004042F907